MSLITAKADRLEKQLLKVKGLTAGELAARAGYPSGRGIAKSLGYLVRKGRARVTREPGQQNPVYIRPAA